MSRRMLMLVALGLAIAVGATTSYAARLVQPPERPEPPPRNDNREQPGPARPGDAPMRVLAGGGIQMTCNEKYVYILRGEELFQYDATTLEPIKKVKIPPPDRQQPQPRGEERRPPRNDDRPPPPPEKPNDDVNDVLGQFRKAKPDAKALAFYSLDWSPSLKEAQARAKQERRPVFFIANTNITAGCNFYTGHT